MSRRSSLGDEWVVIGDLMAGVVGVMVVMFSVAALQVGQTALEARETADELQQAEGERQKSEATVAAQRDALEAQRVELQQERQRGVSGAFAELEGAAASRGLSDVLVADVSHERLRLRQGTFELGSACLDPSVAGILRQWSPSLRELLEATADLTVMVEGHTDARPVINSRSTKATHCARFDDNYTLSAGRAREARASLVEGWPPELTERVAVAAFGQSRPLPGLDRLSPENRRVEIHLEQGTWATQEEP